MGKRLLDVLIFFLILIIAGGGGFVGYTLYQRQQNEEDQPTLQAIVSPPAPTSLLPACTDAEIETVRVEIEAAMRNLEQLPFMQNDTIDTIQEFSTTVLLLEAAVKTYYTDTADMPACAESIHVRNVAGVGIDSLTEFFALTILELYVEQNGDMATADILRRAMTQRDTITSNVLERLDPEIVQGFQVCGDQAAAQLVPYRDLLTIYLDLYPEYESFMQTLSGDFATLFRYEELSLQALEIQNTPCYENIMLENQYAQLFLDTTTAIHVAQLAAFEKARGNPTTAAQLQTIAREHQASAAQLLAVLSPQQ